MMVFLDDMDYKTCYCLVILMVTVERIEKNYEIL